MSRDDEDSGAAGAIFEMTGCAIMALVSVITFIFGALFKLIRWCIRKNKEKKQNQTYTQTIENSKIEREWQMTKNELILLNREYLDEHIEEEQYASRAKLLTDKIALLEEEARGKGIVLPND